MKKLRRIVLALVLLILVGLGVLYFYRNSIVRAAVESQASSSLGLKTTLGGANVGVFGGTLELSQLNIGSPGGYTAPEMFALDKLNLGVNYSDLRKSPIRIKEIAFTKPRVVIELLNGKTNFQAMMDQKAGASAPAPSGSGTPTTPSTPPAGDQTPPADAKAGEPVKLIIEKLTIVETDVVLRAPPILPKDLTIHIPAVTLNNIGTGEGNQNGAAIKDVIAAVMSALASNASASGQLKDFGQLSSMLQNQAQQVLGQVSGELQKQVDTMTKNLTGEFNKAVGNLPGDVGKVIPGGGDVGKLIPGTKDAGKAIDDGLKNLIPGGDKKKDDKKKEDKKK